MQAALPPALAATLDRVARAGVGAGETWWLIGSAAMALHGAAVEVGDVDLLADARDAEIFRLAVDGVRIARAPSDRFRSQAFFEALVAPLKIEIMSGFEVKSDGIWKPVRPLTRQRLRWNGCDVFVPDIAELAALCRTFGRPKDLARATLLDALIPSDQTGIP